MNKKEIMLIAATIFMTVIAWVLFELVSINRNTPTQEQIDQVSLNYKIDISILDTLKKKMP